MTTENDSPEETPSEQEGFMSRWSRRKQQVALEDAQPNQQQAFDNDNLENKTQHSVALSEEQNEAKDELDDTPTEQERLDTLNALTDEDMPALDTLNESSDFSGFMSSNVSEALRKMALRKLFTGKSYNVRDGLDEYDGDYTHFEKLDPSTITSDMKHMMEVAARKLKEKQALEEEEARQALEAEADLIESSEDDALDKENTEILSENNAEPTEDEAKIEIENDNKDTDNLSDTEEVFNPKAPLKTPSPTATSIKNTPNDQQLNHEKKT